MSDIFISYKREEQPMARRLAAALEKQGWSVWWDPKLRAGERFDDVIEEALQEAKCVIVLWSKKSVKSRYVKDEATYALNRGKLVPIAIEDVHPPFRFEGIHTPRLIGWDGSDDFPEFRCLVEDISAMIGHSATESDEAKSSQKREQAQKPTLQPSEKKPEPGVVFCDTLKDGSQGPEMLVIPAGSFEMGDLWGDGYKDEKPVHTVRISNPFALGKVPVMFAEYDTFAEATSRAMLDDCGWGRGQRPGINVSWPDAVAYAEWLSEQTGKRYRLPSEAEWEYAARSGGKKEKWAGTSAEGELGDYAWYVLNSDGKTHPVGRKQPNGLGLYDMSGNVWEWVRDCGHNNYEGAPEDGSAWLEKGDGSRVIRGGSWYDQPGHVRSADRSRSDPADRSSYVGFRLAQDL